MKNFYISSLLLLLGLFVFASCGLHRSKASYNQSFDEIENSILVQNQNPNFPLPEIPESIVDGQDRAIYLSKYYWKEFPFDDVSLINKSEVTE